MADSPRRHRDRSDDRHPHDPERRRRRGHRATDSQGDLLPPAPRRRSRHHSESESPSPRKKKPSSRQSANGSSRDSAPLSLDALAKLDKHNQKKAGWGGYDYDEQYVKEVRKKEKALEKERQKEEKEEKRQERKRLEAYESDAAAEKARARAAREEKRKERKRLEELEAKRRAHESDVAAEEEARALREQKRKERKRLEELESRRRAYESDIAVEEEAQARRQRRRQERSRDHSRLRAATDDEWSRSPAEKKRRSAYTDDEPYADRRPAEPVDDREERRRRWEAHHTPSEIAERNRKRERRKEAKRRVISGPLAEEGGVEADAEDEDEYRYMMEKRGGGGSAPTDADYDNRPWWKRRKRIIIGVVTVLLILAIVIPVAVMMSNKKSNSDGKSSADATSSKPANSNLNGVSESSIPADAKGGILDPFSWYDTEDFNVTYTAETVGGLPIMGLNMTWDDDIKANDQVPNLKDDFGYGKTPIRGVNVGGWLNIEPFITPSFFSSFSTSDNVIDEYTLCTKLGATTCKTNFEQHYSAFVNKQTFADIRAAGFDHVRIPYGYWAVTTYDGDPYVKQVSWRYLLRGIEYARQNGLRVNLDLHGLPGSQNGWNHSGRQGVVGWLNGTDGDLNAQRSLDIHNQLSQFFAQPRYKNVVTMYGLVNEPRMVDLNTNDVLNWTQKAIDIVQKNNISGIIVFGDGFMGLDNWQGKLQDNKNLLLDVHQYVIFNVDQLSLNHTDKLNFACAGWTAQSKRSMDTATGFGPTMCGEWSQADTDCTLNINNIGWGNRWEGTYNTGNSSTSVLSPQCPTKNSPTCSCTKANADPSTYSTIYKQWLYQFAVGQMISFEYGWGWFYWTWQTEKATQWSYKAGMAAGILPNKTWDRTFNCNDTLTDFGKAGLEEYY